MLHANRVRHAELLLLLDLAGVGFAAWMARRTTVYLTGVIHPEWADLLFFTLTALSWTLFGSKLHLYDNKRTEAIPSEALSALATFFLSMAMGVLAVQLLADLEKRRIFYCAFAVTGLTTNVLGRFLFYTILRAMRRAGKDRRRILVIGRNPAVYALLESIKENPHFGVEVVGLLDAPVEMAGEHPSAALPLPGGIEDLGTTKNLRRILSEGSVDEVLVLLPLKSFYSLVEEILKTCQEAGIVTKLAPDLFDVNIARRTISWVGDVPFLTYFTGPKETLELTIKRLIDMVVSAGALLVLSPLMGAIALAVKLTSPGPVFFRQTRAGLNGRLFTMLKFRSMYIDAEERKKELLAHNEMDGPVFKMENDPRITPVGRFLRKFSLDELPQLINVLKGDMSLVGPRPPVPEEVEKYDWWQRRRLSFRPGLTCIWQVSGRNKIGFKEWMEMDLAYIDNWSLALDFILLLRTIPVVLSGKGAS